jgi:flagellar assembly factor FliW
MLTESLLEDTRDVSEQEIIYFPNGIIGFEDHTKFTIVEDPQFRPFSWLISLDHKDFALPMVNPFLLINEYRMQFPDELAQELKKNGNHFEVFCIISLNGENGGTTINLKGPILIDYLKKQGKQIVLNADILPISYPFN